MDKRSLKILEFDKVLSNISDYGINQEAKERILKLTPLTDSKEIKRLQKEIDESIQLILAIGKPPISSGYNILSFLDRTLKDSELSPDELLKISTILRITNNLINYINLAENLDSYSELNKYYSSLTQLNTLEKEISTKILSEDEIADNASKKLAQIRKEKVTKNSSISRSLNKIISNQNNEKFLQDNFISIRNGRYVIPIKTEYKNSIPGTIIDRSSSGSTVFIEPLSVLQLNNELNELEIEEQKEIHRILREFSKKVKDHYYEIKLNYESLIDLDVINSKANYALDTNSHQAEITKNSIDLKKARHPLIDKNKVVASNITINKDTKTLVITGPNTGGKTVSLKTIGLLAAMNQSGLFIPVEEGSKLKLFQNIFADIGDEQSIEQNLSTFSSHLTNLINIFNYNRGNSLILLDELGAGTDPIEGAALAISILNNLKQTTNLTIATTHYPEIKEFALIENNVQNASMEFDVKSLSPTYRLIIGIPGRSNAFEIAQRLGLSKNIINNAKERMDYNQIQLSESLDQAQNELFKAREERKLAQEYRIRAQEEYDKQRKETEKLKEKRDKILEKTKKNAQLILNETKKQTDFIYKEIQNIQKNSTQSIDNSYLENLRKGFKEIDNNLEKINQYKTEKQDTVLKFEDFSIGDRVLIKSLDQEVIVSNILEKEKRIEVSTGSIRMKFKPKDLLKLKPKKEKPKVQIKRNTKKMNTTLDLRGKTVDETIMLLDDFINDALLLDQNKLEVIHGFGTGQVRNAVHNYLKKSSHIKSFRLGGPGEGGAGATVFELK